VRGPNRRNDLEFSKGSGPVGPLAKGKWSFTKFVYAQTGESEGDEGMEANDPRARSVQRILLAEDDEDMRRFLVKALEKAGYDVVSFGNGLEAYERLKEEPFMLLLTDIVMPEMDGIELARKASEIDPDLKIMFITGFAAVALNPDNNAPKDAKILSKPFHLRDLVDQVERMLAA
jgi:two-component system cell cycle response regulator CpdR